MSRPSFRPRPIDLNKPLPIIKSSKDLRHEDDVLVSRTLPAMATGMDPAEEEERHLQQALLASVMGGGNGSGPAGRTKSLEIPVPVVSVVPGYDEAPFTQFVRPPSHYIVFDKNDEELERTTVEYDADFTDERFLADLSARAPPGITADALERGMDALEKAQSRSTTLPPYGPPIRALLSPLISSDAARKELHRHWVARRIERGGRSFLRLHQPPVSPGNTDPSVAFRPRDGAAGGGGRTCRGRQNTYENYKRAVLLQKELVQARSLVVSMLRRERLKAELASIDAFMARADLARSGPRLAHYFRQLAAGEGDGVTLAEPVIGASPTAAPDSSATGLVPGWDYTLAGSVTLPLSGLALPRELLAGATFGPPPPAALAVPPPGMSAGPLAVRRPKKPVRRRPGVGGSTGGARARGAHVTAAATAARKASAAANASRRAAAAAEKAAGGDGGRRDGRDGVAGRGGGRSGSRGAVGAVTGAAGGLAAVRPHGLDAFLFDVEGQKFLRNMRYFAGGFINYGVSPYDHRVFAAASERNTVRDVPMAPAAVDLDARKIGALAVTPLPEDEPDVDVDRDGDSDADAGHNIARRLSRGGKRGAPSTATYAPAAKRARTRQWASSGSSPDSPLTAPSGLPSFATRNEAALGVDLSAAAAADTKRRRAAALVAFAAAAAAKGLQADGTPVPFRGRGRLGRGGRLIFDRVVYEPERGVRAASYPASVAMGGAYTAGVPYHDAGTVLGDSYDWVHEPDAEVRALMAPLAPLTPAATVVGRTIDGADLYWPSRKHAVAMAARREEELHGSHTVRTRRMAAEEAAAAASAAAEPGGDGGGEPSQPPPADGEEAVELVMGADISRLPAFSVRQLPLVVEMS